MLKGYKAYISCPISIDWADMKAAIKQVETEVDTVTYWKRNTTYNQNFVRDCDVFILLLPNIKFKASRGSLPPGCRNELDRALASGKPIYIVYKAQHGWKTYDTEISYGHNAGISGLAGTSHRLANDNQLFADKYVEKMHEIKMQHYLQADIEATIEMYKRTGFMFLASYKTEDKPDRRLLLRRR